MLDSYICDLTWEQMFEINDILFMQTVNNMGGFYAFDLVKKTILLKSALRKIRWVALFWLSSSKKDPHVQI